MAMRRSPSDGLVQRTVRQKLLVVGTGFWVRVGVVSRTTIMELILLLIRESDIDDLVVCYCLFEQHADCVNIDVDILMLDILT